MTTTFEQFSFHLIKVCFLKLEITVMEGDGAGKIFGLENKRYSSIRIDAGATGGSRDISI